MLWHLFLIPLAVANELITLSPDVDSLESTDDASESDLFVGDSLICNSVECYPKIFEATKEWQTIKPAQHLPGGLDIRMNLDTGLKEAKLGPEASDVKFATKEVNTVEETTEYEFSKDFTKVKQALEDKKYDLVESTLDDLVDFAHDYKHGYKIVVHELPLLKQLMFGPHIPIQIKETSARILTGCVRNNPPVLEYINEHDPSLVTQIFNSLDSIISSPLDHDSTGLVKRLLSIVHALVSNKPTEINEDTLSRLYRLRDKQIKMRVLEILSSVYQNLSPEAGPLSKRSLDETNVQKWFNEFATLIQDSDVDELHIREFFNSMYNIKKELGKAVKVDPSFLNWLSEEGEKRLERLHDKLSVRDSEQDDFDHRFVESRHLVFGNPMAHRMKHFADEL
ncbi:LAFE_0D10594g1_1 [Lachancea fermentati]|uniref:Nucleotide exchange factor SIL1 n=1 Tax=Lachancea fermentati TaxID=4955 RepID=A0A1G4MBQ6_LACFM|nr:LAFE_0D10594g1_1 [Lachancea fermentati]